MDSNKKTVFAQALFAMFGINRLGTVRGDEVQVLTSYLETCKAFPDAGMDGLINAFGEILNADNEVATAVIDDFTKFVENSRFLKEGDEYSGDKDRYNRPHGHGTLKEDDGESQYTGDFQNGKKHGKGTLSLQDGSSYTGEFADDRPCGTCVYTDPSGEVSDVTFHVDGPPTIVPRIAQVKDDSVA